MHLNRLIRFAVRLTSTLELTFLTTCHRTNVRAINLVLAILLLGITPGSLFAQNNWYSSGGIPSSISVKTDSKERTLLLITKVKDETGAIRGIYDSRTGKPLKFTAGETVITKISGKWNQGSETLFSKLKKSTTFTMDVIRLRDGKSIPESAATVIVATRLAGAKQTDVEVRYLQALHHYTKLTDYYDQTILPTVRKVATTDRWDLVTDAEFDVFNRGLRRTNAIRAELKDRIDHLYMDTVLLELESITDDSISATKANDMHKYLEKELLRFRKNDIWFQQSITRYELREKRIETERQRKIAGLIKDVEQSQAEFELLGSQIDQQLTQLKWDMAVEEAEIAIYNQEVEEYNASLEAQQQEDYANQDSGSDFNNSSAHYWNQQLFFNRGYSTNPDHRPVQD